MMKPLLSIGIIFKNEIRCLERCLKSLENLRATIPCELVMADTGSDDGSREIAQRYADILFDFLWADDFAAARNAVMDRCSGKWYLSIDADEWLDEDVSQLVGFLKRKPHKEQVGGLTVRNYFTREDSLYSEFLGLRLAYMPAGLRYVGAIHEYLEDLDGRMQYIYPISTILHHDGYVMLNDGSEAGREKLRRNMRILKKELEEDPENLRTLVQCVESCGPDYQAQLPYIRDGVKLVREKHEGWIKNGANLMRYAVCAAHKLGLPELPEWLALAEELFPTSIYTMVDIQFDMAEHAWCDMDCPTIISRGQRYLKGVQEYRAGHFDVNETILSPLRNGRSHDETTLRACVARALAYEGQPEAALETLQELDYDTMDAGQAGGLLETLLRIHALSGIDTAPFLTQVWARINEPKPSQEAADQRRQSFIAGASYQFSLNQIQDETAHMNGEISLGGIGQMRAEEWNVLSKLRPCRYGYTLFKPLAGKTEIGTAALLMDEEDPETAARLLAGVENFDGLPIQALTRALLRGTRFPDRHMNIEEMDGLAARLAQDKASLRTLAERAASDDYAGSWQTLLWARGLVLAAVKTCAWKDGAEDMALARVFAKVERAFLTAYYAPEVLREGNVFALPVMHRSGWYCVQAFDALEAGDVIGYARYLREGLASCEGMKAMVEFLTEHTPELQTPPPSPELLALAEKIRMILSAYPADDPAVTALKASPAYQKVAYLIEGENA